MASGDIRRAIHSDRFPKPVASYSQGFQMGNTLFITGQLPVDPETNLKVGDGDITIESKQVMRNMQAVLEEAGFAFKDVVSATVYLTDINKLDARSKLVVPSVIDANKHLTETLPQQEHRESTRSDMSLNTV